MCVLSEIACTGFEATVSSREQSCLPVNELQPEKLEPNGVRLQEGVFNSGFLQEVGDFLRLKGFGGGVDALSANGV